MIKLVFCLRRRPELSRTDFQTYWRDTHGPLVAERAEVLKIRRYVQVHTSTELDGLHAAFQRRNGGAPESFDGVAELWFDSLDDAAPQSDAARTASAELLADERTFIDLANSPMWMAEERPVVG